MIEAHPHVCTADDPYRHERHGYHAVHPTATYLRDAVTVRGARLEALYRCDYCNTRFIAPLPDHLAVPKGVTAAAPEPAAPPARTGFRGRPLQGLQLRPVIFAGGDDPHIGCLLSTDGGTDSVQRETAAGPDPEAGAAPDFTLEFTADFGAAPLPVSPAAGGLD